MKPVRTIAALAGAAALATLGMVTASSAQAATAQAVTCSGELSSGTYLSVTVNDYCQVPNGAKVVVKGSVTVNTNAFFDAGTASTLTVRGNVTAGQGAMVQIGCTVAHDPCGEEPGIRPMSGSGWIPVFSNDRINGSVLLSNVYNAAFNGVTIDGNLISDGGGAGLNSGDNGSYSIKDDVIGGNVRVWDLTTDWFGIIRSNIGGYVDLRRIKNSRIGEDDQPDGNEVVANNIGQSLVCQNNSPKNQYGDAVFEGPYPGYGANTVGGRATGQCAALTQPPVIPEVR